MAWSASTECQRMTSAAANCRDFRQSDEISGAQGLQAAFAPTSADSGADPTHTLCLGMADLFVTLFLVVLVASTIIGNTLVILSVAVYKRMRTFTNLLLVSLSSADLLVGVLIMPIAVIDQLQRHRWTFGRLTCKLWASADVLLCTASILNLCVISLDRYFAITSPLRYSRTRSSKLAAGLVLSVWSLSIVICSPPLLVPEWHFKLEPYTCGYAKAVPYRIYSALGSFYIPLFVMLFVYYKIFRVASSREQMLNIDRRGSRTMQMWKKSKSGGAVTSSAVRSGPLRSLQLSSMAIAQYQIMQPHPTTQADGGNGNGNDNCHDDVFLEPSTSLQQTNCATMSVSGVVASPLICGHRNNKQKRRRSCDTDDACLELTSAADRITTPRVCCKKHVTIVDEGDNIVPLLTETAKDYFDKTVPWSLMGTANEYFDNSKPNRTSREKMIYLKERKALKTIGIVVCGFIICWLPFFVLYVVEVVCDSQVISEVVSASMSSSTSLANVTQQIWTFNLTTRASPTLLDLTDNLMTSSPTTFVRQLCHIPPVLSDIFLWLGYSNSVANPIVYTFYNRDFRRCFKDLVSCGCLRRSVNRRMSVRRLHQTRL